MNCRRSFLQFYLFPVILFSLLSLHQVSGQQEPDSDYNVNRGTLKAGINYHLQIRHIDFAPVVFYRFNKGVEAGIGVNYLFNFSKDDLENTHVYGANVFARGYFLRNFFLHLEYLYTDVPYRNDLNFELRRVNIASFFMGLGYRQALTSKVDSYLFCLADLTYREESPYKNLLLLKLGLSF